MSRGSALVQRLRSLKGRVGTVLTLAGGKFTGENARRAPICLPFPMGTPRFLQQEVLVIVIQAPLQPPEL